jgi:sialic acid synthase SpsE
MPDEAYTELMEMLKKYFVTIEQMRKFRDYSYAKGLEFIVTPFDYKSLEDVISLKCSALYPSNQSPLILPTCI